MLTSVRSWLALGGIALACAVPPASAASDPASATVMIRIVGEVTAALGTDAGGWRPSTELRDVRLGTGSGVIVSPDGYIVTNAHVIRPARANARIEGRILDVTLTVQRVEVVLPGAGDGAAPQVLDATVLFEDQGIDLAVLHVGVQGLPYLVLSDGSGLSRGDPVTAWGYPLGDRLQVETAEGVEAPPVSASAGSVAAFRTGIPGFPSDVPYVQMTTPLNPGNSGGPLTDADGYVVGIVQAKLNRAEGVGFAIASQVVRECLERRAMDAVLPVTRLAPGSAFELAAKGLRFRPPGGFADVSPSRLRVHSGDSLGPVALVVDRVATPLSVADVERAVLDGVAFGSDRATPIERRLPLVPGPRVKAGVARIGDAEGRMLYAVIGAGTETVVARAFLSADDLAFNLGVLCEVLASLEVTPLIKRPVTAPLERRLYRTRGHSVGVLPTHTLVEPGVDVPGCLGLPEATSALVVSAEGDFTVRFVATWWPAPAETVRARARPSSERRHDTSPCSASGTSTNCAS